jgi:hypothetical protein
MSDEARERQGHGDEQRPEGQQPPEEGYESPRVDDIPLDRPAVTDPGFTLLVQGGSPDTDD